MRRILSLTLILFVVQLIAPAAPLQAQAGQDQRFGPEVTAFLKLLKDEETELEFQIKRNEISRKNYLRSKNRIAVMRQAVTDLVKESGEDIVPELHAVTASEVDMLIEDGLKALKKFKPGEIVNENWRLVNIIQNGEAFYVLERLKKM